jgi:hypothetical protein
LRSPGRIWPERIFRLFTMGSPASWRVASWVVNWVRAREETPRWRRGRFFSPASFRVGSKYFFFSSGPPTLVAIVSPLRPGSGAL